MKSLVLMALMLMLLVPSLASAREVTLTFVWPTFTASKVRYGQQITEDFMKDYPHIKLDTIYTVEDPRFKYTVMTAAGMPPDVGWMGAGWQKLAHTWLPLDPLMERDRAEVDPEDFFPAILDGLRWNGVLYSVPSGFQPIVFYYNKDLYDEAGLAYPTEDWTVEDMIAWGEKLTRDTTGDGNADQWGVMLDHGYVWSWIYYGGQIADPTWTKARINNPGTRAGLEVWRDVFGRARYEIAPPAAIKRELGLINMFAAGRSAMYAAGVWALEHMEKYSDYEIDIVTFPWLRVGDERRRGSILYLEEIYINMDTRYPEEAWTFLKWMISPQHMSWASKEGHIIPSRRSVAYSDTFLRPDKNMAAFLKSTEFATVMVPHPRMDDIFSAVNPLISEFMAGRLTSAAAMEQAQARIQAILDEGVY